MAKKLQIIGNMFKGFVKKINGIIPDEDGNVEIHPDWNQNDSTSADYVNNRTHWVEELVRANDQMIRITDQVPNDFTSEVTYTFNGTSYTDIPYRVDEYYYGLDDVAFINKDNYVDGGGTIYPLKGTYVFKQSNNRYVSRISWDGFETTWDGSPNRVHTIDPKYLPTGNDAPYYSKSEIDNKISSIVIPDPVTDDHINSLIDNKIGVIENGSY